MTEVQLIADVMHDFSDGRASLKYDDDHDGRTYRPRNLGVVQDILGALDEGIPYKITVDWDFFENWAEIDRDDE